MAKNRKAAETFLTGFLKEIDPSGYNVKKYTEILSTMTDENFDRYMIGIRDKTMKLIIFVPPYKTSGFSTENTIRVAEKYGIPIFEQLLVTDGELSDYTTNQEFLLLDLASRRQAQNLFKKASIPRDNKTIDYLTYQPTGESKGSSLSQPEFGVLDSMGLSNTVEELFRFRGGDKGGFRAYQEVIGQYGSVNLKSIYGYTTGVESTKALRNYMLGMGMILRT